MRVLAVPQWSFGRDRRLLAECGDLLQSLGLLLHYCESDVDHNRTVTAFSGSFSEVEMALSALADLILPSINLNHHVGAHPRTGGLDICPITPLEPPKTRIRAARLQEWIESIAATLAERFELPVFLYEKSERDRREPELAELRKGGFGGLLEARLRPDFGPSRAHPHLGVTLVGWRDFVLSFNVNLTQASPFVAQRLAQRVRDLRAEGDSRMLGVRAMGLPLLSREASQVALMLTLPDITAADPVIDYVVSGAARAGVETAYVELIGTVREQDLPGATRLHPRPSQVLRSLAPKSPRAR